MKPPRSFLRCRSTPARTPLDFNFLNTKGANTRLVYNIFEKNYKRLFAKCCKKYINRGNLGKKSIFWDF